nr:unnamed protein product [Callosobruchus chinensis]
MCTNVYYLEFVLKLAASINKQQYLFVPAPIVESGMAASVRGVPSKLSNVFQSLKAVSASRSYFTYTPEPAQPIKGKEPKWVSSAEEAFQDLKSEHTEKWLCPVCCKQGRTTRSGSTSAITASTSNQPVTTDQLTLIMNQ